MVPFLIAEGAMEDLSASVKAKGSVRWDAVSLGEVMLRLDPGEERIHTARTTWRAGCGGASG